jgi:hypothetical protein
MDEPEIDMRLYRLVTVENAGHEHQYNVCLNYDTANKVVEKMLQAGCCLDARLELIPPDQVELLFRPNRRLTMIHLN